MTEDVGSWGWEKETPGHFKMLILTSHLRSNAESFMKELRSARAAMMSAKESSQKAYDTSTYAARTKLENDKKTLKTNCDSSIESFLKNSDVGERYMSACRSFLDSIRSQDHFKGCAEACAPFMSQTEKQSEAVKKAIDKVVAAYRDLFNCQVADAESIANEHLDKARKVQLDKDAVTDREYGKKTEDIVARLRTCLAAGLDRKEIKSYSDQVSAMRFDGARFEPMEEVPDAVFMGKFGLVIHNTDADSMTVIQQVSLAALGAGSKEGSEFVFRVPYCQRLADGISLMISYDPDTRDRVKDMMQPLLLKMFLSFPPGKIEATMIDPLEMGATFPDIPRLATGPSSEHVIDTKAWSKEKDIERAIATLRQQMENITAGYGTNSEARLRKEVVKVLAVTDFPTGFSANALKDLRAIIRNSAALGVCVFISADRKELDALRAKNPELVDEIDANMVVTRAISGRDRLMLSGGEPYRDMFIELDPMEDVAAHKDELITLMADAIEHNKPKSESFADMFSGDIYDSNLWGCGSQGEIAVPIGIKGADNVVKLVMGRTGGSTEHHALVAGPTGAGKSSFLHTLIMSAMVSYTPDQLQLYLLDFKEGVEFNIYTQYRLPSLRVVAIKSEREFGLNVLDEMCKELESRAKLFSRKGVTEIEDYEKLVGEEKVPRILLIFDEIQDLFRSSGGAGDNITSQVIADIGKLVTQGRSHGIHLILACQDFRNCPGLSDYFSQMKIRIAISGSRDGASSVLSSDNRGVSALQGKPVGTAIYNIDAGDEAANSEFRICFQPGEERKELLERMDEYYTDPDVAERYKRYQTRVLLTNAEEDINNCFNQLILRGRSSVESISSSKDGYGLLLGQGFGKRAIFVPELRKRPGDNLLIVTRDENTALSLFELGGMSVLYDELHTSLDKNNTLLYIADLSDAELDDYECGLKDMAELFPRQVERAGLGDLSDLIDTLYELLMDRAEGVKPADERIFLMFFGLNRAKNKLGSDLMYDYDDGLTPGDKLTKLLELGPRYGINSIIWGESMKGVETILGANFGRYFSKRVAYDIDAEAMEKLVSEEDAGSLRGKTAAYMDVSSDVRNTHFRPYDVPTKSWMERYAEAYDTITGEEM